MHKVLSITNRKVLQTLRIRFDCHITNLGPTQSIKRFDKTYGFTLDYCFWANCIH